MLDYNSIHTEFQGLVGFKQTEDPCTPVLGDNLTSTSLGLYVNDVAPMWLKNEFIDKCLPNYSQNYTYDSWDNTTTYALNKRVEYSGNIFLSLVANNLNNTPVGGDNDANWRLLTEAPGLAKWLKEARESAVKNLVNGVLQGNEQLNGSQTLGPGSFGAIFEGSPVTQMVSLTNGEFRGILLRPDLRYDVKIQLRRIGLKVASAQTLSLYLFHSSKNEPLGVYQVVIPSSNAGKFAFYDILDSAGNPVYLDYMSTTKQAGGDYYLGFFESQVTGQIQEFQLRNQSENTYVRLNHYKNLVSLDFIKVQSSYLNGTNLFQIGHIEDLQDEALFNLDMVCYSDKTYSIIAGKQIWGNAIQLAIAVEILRAMASSPELNRIQGKADEEIPFLLFGNKEANVMGLEHKLSKAKANLIEQYRQSVDGFEDNFKPKYNFS